MERLRLRDEVENLQMQLASLEGETPRAIKDDTLRLVAKHNMLTICPTFLVSPVQFPMAPHE